MILKGVLLALSFFFTMNIVQIKSFYFFNSEKDITCYERPIMHDSNWAELITYHSNISEKRLFNVDSNF